MLEMSRNFCELSKLYTNHFDVIRADTPALLDRVYEIRYQVYCLKRVRRSGPEPRWARD